MEVKFTKPFEKDLKAMTNKSAVLKIDEIIEAVKITDSLSNFPGLKILKGYKDCYRIRIGNFRLGLQLDGKVIWLARLMHRKEIYRYFP